MVPAEDRRELLKAAYEMGELLVSSDYGSGNRWGVWEVVKHSSGFVDGN